MVTDKDKVLTAIYGFDPQGLEGRNLEVISLYNQDGLVPENILDEAYAKMFNSRPAFCFDGSVKFFETLDDLQKYIFEICQNLKNKGVSLVSVDVFNAMVMESFTVEELKKRLEEKGKFMTNPDAGKSNFFNRLLS